MEQKQADELKYWTAVRENPADFNSWTFLLQTVDQQGDIQSIREAYNAFLEEYPLCYMYWKKLADHEQTRGDPEVVRKVYERGVAAIPYSVDLWVHYCTYLLEKNADVNDSRSVLERAAVYIGTDYLAGAFWDKYLEFELAHKEFGNATALFVHLLSLSLESIGKYFERWKAFASTRQIGELLTSEEKAQWGEEDEATQREKMNAAREQQYLNTLSHLTKRQPYEAVIRDRPYFHVKPLMDNEIQAWHNYLNFEEKEGDHMRTIKLYERCLVACCNYPEFWRRYCDYLENEVGIEQARLAWGRAASIYLKRRPDIHLDYALFEETQGETEKAKTIYLGALSLAPGHVESVIRWAEFHKRLGDVQTACNILSEAIASSQFEVAAPFLAMNLARLQEHALGNIALARATYREAIAKTPDNKNIWLAAINFETAHTNEDTTEKEEDMADGFTDQKLQRVINLYSRAISEDSKLAEEDRVDIWHNYLDFLHAFHADTKAIHKLKGRFYRAFPGGRTKTKKRAAQGGPFKSSKQAKGSPELSSPPLPAATASNSSLLATPLMAAPPMQMAQLPTPQGGTPQYGVPPQGYGAMYAQYGGYQGGYGGYPAPTPTAGGWPMQQAAVYGAPTGGYGGYPYQQPQPPYTMDGASY